MINSSLKTVYYTDTSALVKRYVTESGSIWVQTLCDSSANTIATVRITKAEAAAAFAGKYRSGGWSQADYVATLQDLAHDFSHQYLAIDIDQSLVDLAVELTRRQKLRGYDAIQLAGALILNETLTQAQFPSLTFVAADDGLLQAAQNENLTVVNPVLQS